MYIPFVGNLFLVTCCDFYYDDVITIMSLALRTQSCSIFTYQYSFTNRWVLNSTASYRYEKMNKFSKHKRTF